MSSKLTDLIARWRAHPEAFVREAIGAEPDPWQVVALNALITHKRVSIAACHGVGKDALASWAILWVLLTHSFPKVPASAPTAHQLFDLLLSECSKWMMRMHPALRGLLEQTADRIFRKAYPETWFMVARTARKEASESLQGFHSDNLLIVVDEASGVPDIIFEVLEGAMTGPNAMQLLIGNPTQSSGFFYDSHHSDRSRWFTMRICAKAAEPDAQDGNGIWYSDRPSADYVAAMAKKYGRESNVYRVRVLGLFPRSDDDQTIPLEWVEAAAARELYDNETSALCLGVDVARFGSDASAVVAREGRNILHAEQWHGNDVAQTSGRIIALAHTLSRRMDPDHTLYLFVDTVGVGGGVADNLRAYLYGQDEALPWVVVDVESGGKSPEDGCLRMRDALWWRAREYFRTSEPALSEGIDHETRQQLMGELASPKYDYAPNGKIKVESKEDMKERGIDSPNLADALIYTLDFEAQKPQVDERPSWYKRRQQKSKGSHWAGR